MNAMAWQVGDVVPHEVVPFWSEASQMRWHGLIVPPMWERRTSTFLAGRGVYAFHPVRNVVVRRAGKSIHQERAILPRYVFAKFPGTVAWHRLLDLPFFVDVIRVADGRPAVLDPADLTVIHDLRARHEAETRERDAAAMRRCQAMRPLRGKPARILTGAFAGEVAQVLEIKGERAKLRLRLFSAAIDAEVGVEALVRVGG